jgi:hypothetical protein
MQKQRVVQAEHCYRQQLKQRQHILEDISKFKSMQSSQPTHLKLRDVDYKTLLHRKLSSFAQKDKAHQWFVEASFSNDHSERVDASSLIAHCHISSHTVFLKMYRRWKDCTKHATVRCQEGTWTIIDITVQFELAGLVPMMNA